MLPELKLKEGGKFPIKAISRDVIPHAVVDRPKGYFPVPPGSTCAARFLN